MKEDKHIKVIAGTLFLAAMILAYIGILFHDVMVQGVIWEFGNMCSACGCALMAAKLNRDSHDMTSAGFALLVVAESFAIAGTANRADFDWNIFGAELVLYSPAYMLIGLYSGFKWWIRIVCLLLCIPFSIEAYRIMSGSIFDPKSFLNVSAYLLRSVAYIGFAITLFRTKTGEKVY